MTALAPVMQAFFTDRLMTQRAAAPHTIASYRDTFRLLLCYVHDQTGKQPAQLQLADLDAATIGAFLAHLEASRGNSAATRNCRLAAIHSLFRYAALRAPDQMDTISRVLAIQSKRTATTIVSYLTPAELDAVLTAPDQAAWHGRRDHALLVLAAQTGLRVSEITGLAIHDAHPGTGAHVYCRGKGRKDRCTPLTSHTAGVLAEWTAERGAPGSAPLFGTRSGTAMSADAVARLNGKYAAMAAESCPSLTAKKITPHTLRHTAAMNLQRRGVASDATFRRSREDGAVRDGGPSTAERRSRRQSEAAGQEGRDRTVLRQLPPCCIHSGCIRRKHDAAEERKSAATRADATIGRSSR